MGAVIGIGGVQGACDVAPLVLVVTESDDAIVGEGAGVLLLLLLLLSSIVVVAVEAPAGSGLGFRRLVGRLCGRLCVGAADVTG